MTRTRGAGLVLGITVGVGCLDPTQITLSLSTNASCTKGFGTNVYVASDQAVAATTDQCSTVDDVHNTIGTVVVVPGASGDRAEIRVVGTIDPTMTPADRCGDVFSKAAADLTAADKIDLAHCILARRSVGFIQHTMLDLPIWLDSTCAGVLCPDNQTCVSGNCVDDHVDCQASGCSQPDGGTPPDASPPPAVPATPATIYANGDATCVITTKGNVQCWGANSGGKMGIGDGLVASPRNVGISGMKDLSLGATHGCGIDTTGAVSCWGTNAHSEVAPGSPTMLGVLPPAKLTLGAASSIAVGASHSCAIVTANGSSTVHCWGDSSQNKLGSSSGGDVLLPTGYSASALAAGSNHTCALVANSKSTGSVACWGLSTDGQAGAYGLMTIMGGSQAIVNNTFVAAGGNQSVAGSPTQLWWWGSDSAGQLTGMGGATINAAATLSTVMKGADRAAVGDNHICGVLGGVVTCWGAKESAVALGGTPPGSVTAVTLTSPVGVQRIAAGRLHTCAIGQSAYDGNRSVVWCWGDNSYNQLGPIKSTSSGPIEVPLAPEP